MANLTNLERKIIHHDRIPWIEKYRPRTIEELILDPQLLLRINKIITDKEMPNIIITGPPGIGKTTTIMCIVRGLFVKHANEACLKLNASDDRGIKTVQETIMNFCKKKMDLNDYFDTQNLQKDEYPNHKIIMLDEADNMTDKAQHQINNLMEKFHETARFAFTCNSSEDIIEGIQSKCIILRYSKLTNEHIIAKLKYICEKEKIVYEDGSLESIAFLAQGDARSAINILQLVFTGYEQLTVDYIYDICDKPQPVVVKQIFTHCKNKEFVKATTLILDLKSKGYSELDIILTMINVLKLSGVVNGISYDDLTQECKIKFLKALSHSAYIISKGLDNPLQLVACISNMIK